MAAPGYGGPSWVWDRGYGGPWLWRAVTITTVRSFNTFLSARFLCHTLTWPNRRQAEDRMLT